MGRISFDVCVKRGKKEKDNSSLPIFFGSPVYGPRFGFWKVGGVMAGVGPEQVRVGGWVSMPRFGLKIKAAVRIEADKIEAN